MFKKSVKGETFSRHILYFTKCAAIVRHFFREFWQFKPKSFKVSRHVFNIFAHDINFQINFLISGWNILKTNKTNSALKSFDFHNEPAFWTGGNKDNVYLVMDIGYVFLNMGFGQCLPNSNSTLNSSVDALDLSWETFSWFDTILI